MGMGPPKPRPEPIPEEHLIGMPGIPSTNCPTSDRYRAGGGYLSAGEVRQLETASAMAADVARRINQQATSRPSVVEPSSLDCEPMYVGGCGPIALPWWAIWRVAAFVAYTAACWFFARSV